MAKLDKDSLGNTFFIAIFLCLVCSVVVSGMAVALKPIQKLNKELDQKKNILRAAGLMAANATESDDGKSIEELFAQFTVRAVNLQSGEYVDVDDIASYDPIKTAGDASQSISLTSDEDIATLRRRENVSLVYIKTKDHSEWW